ncbi:Crp/Fnr family transcriptional regulator [Flagellimonas hymeniacidonis]|uniref:Crp/Fnr family transcriptional regulator n=1 Tax=Flagellimonas hymeniacidonis TaxID=2603628 RepID=A0A5C8V6R3_9FLAO|nr:Crp/Fnr family transcriptional regulator [Flagellimonas hymeniacidonis]TXN36950.1 Crp/Fnr family transcriptional regulator [Flagellimonas hymeniacidonis]
MISNDLLKKYGAEKVHLSKKEVLFKVDTLPRYYFQVISGKIKMNNFNEDGKEFIQGIFSEGSSFGEPPLFADLTYPAYAEAVEESTVWRLEKKKFFELLKENSEVHLSITKVLAGRLHYKATMVAEISSESPEHRLLKLIDYFKTHIHKIPDEEPYLVELSRQQMADLTGLRVETVIRAIKSMEKKRILQLQSHKIVR